MAGVFVRSFAEYKLRVPLVAFPARDHWVPGQVVEVA